jgi:hypothetical protein
MRAPGSRGRICSVGEAETGDTGATVERARTPRFDILIAVLLGVTALLAAGAAFLADRDDGRQLRFLQEADVTLAEANDLYAAGDRQRAAYGLFQYAEGDALREESEALFARGDFYDERGDKFVLATVFLALALALLGVASVIWIRAWRLGLTVAGTASTITGAAIIMVNLA